MFLQMKKAHPELAIYKNNWACERMTLTYLRNSRRHKRTLGLLGKRQKFNKGGRSAELPIPDNDEDMEFSEEPGDSSGEDPIQGDADNGEGSNKDGEGESESAGDDE
jgi:hypothetical protein